jgi:DNA-binding LytR/AlgR family response regulator
MNPRPTALVADDEPHLLDHLCRQLAAAWPELLIVARAASGPEAAELIALHRPDVAFLDIRMPGATGLQVAQALSVGAPKVVFVTAFDQYALDAFEANAVDYLLKPVREERLARAVDKLRRAAAPATRDLGALLAALETRLKAPAPARLRWIRASRRDAEGELTEQIAVADVLYFQADDKYTCVFARDGAQTREWLIRVPLSELAQQLPTEDFAQVHRSVLVNLNAVAGTRRDLGGKLFLRIRDHPRELPVARQYLHLFRQM